MFHFRTNTTLQFLNTLYLSFAWFWNSTYNFDFFSAGANQEKRWYRQVFFNGKWHIRGQCICPFEVVLKKLKNALRFFIFFCFLSLLISHLSIQVVSQAENLQAELEVKASKLEMVKVLTRNNSRVLETRKGTSSQSYHQYSIL